MSADILRRAAFVLRERAEACEPIHGDDDNRSWADEFDAAAHEREHGYYSPDVAYIAMMHPGLALALADWLESVPACADCEPAAEAHEVARLILEATS